MRRKVMMGLCALIAVVAVGGIGYAAFTSTAVVSVGATGGSVTLIWGPAPLGYGSDPCTSVTYSDNELYVTAEDLGPSESCQFTDPLYNNGNLQAELSSSIDWVSCSPTLPYVDNVDGITLTPGGSVNYIGTIGPMTTDTVCDFTVTVTGTAD